MTSALTGIRVLELSHFVAAPSAGLILADLGAEVIKLEPPRGDPTRVAKKNAVFYVLNRNKASLAIDLKRAEGIALFLRLVETADVVLDNFVPGTLESLGIGYDVMAERNPRLVYSEIRGFLPGPNGSRPLMDEAAQMMAGLAYMTGPPGQPVRAGASVVDYGSGMWCVIGILAALHARAATGRGCRVDVGLFESCLHFVAHSIAQASITGEAPPPMPIQGMGAQLGVSVYRLFDTADGRQVFIAVVSDQQWERACAELGLADLWADLSLRARTARAERREELEARVERVTTSMPAAALMELLTRAEIPFAPVNTPLDVLGDDHLAASGGILDIRVPEAGDESPEVSVSRIRAPRLPLRGVNDEPPGMPPRLGQDTRRLLASLGCGAGEIQRLVDTGVVRAL